MGKSASGKDTIYAALLEEFKNVLNPLILYTTRPPRPGEVSGITYNFITPEDIISLEKEGKIIESRVYNTAFGEWIYATVEDSSIDLSTSNYIGIGTLESAEKIINYFDRAFVIPIYIDVEDPIRIQRVIKRELEGKQEFNEMCRRWLADEKDFSEENINKINPIRVSNDASLEEVLSLLKDIVVKNL